MEMNMNHVMNQNQLATNHQQAWWFLPLQHHSSAPEVAWGIHFHHLTTAV